MVLQDEGAFFVNGRIITTNYPNIPATGLDAPGEIAVNQMYVQYRIPYTPFSKPGTYPVVMVHGSNHTGMTYETTPDGREGWATYFVRHGFPVYVVDHSGRGRSGFDPTSINQAKAENNPALLPTVFVATKQRAWVNFLFGPSYLVPWPDEQFPLDSFDQYVAQLVPNAETTLAGGANNTVDALAALLDKIGPAIVMVHSQSGSYGLDAVRRRPNLVKGLIDVEGNCAPLSATDIASYFSQVPLLALWGDHSEGAVGANGDARRNGCVASVASIKAVGGPATFTLLPEMGIRGNSHMLMMDRNNLQVADVVLDWIARNVK